MERAYALGAPAASAFEELANQWKGKHAPGVRNAITSAVMATSSRLAAKVARNL